MKHKDSHSHDKDSSILQAEINVIYRSARLPQSKDEAIREVTWQSGSTENTGIQIINIKSGDKSKETGVIYLDTSIKKGTNE